MPGPDSQRPMRLIVYEAIEDCSRCVREDGSLCAHTQAAQWCTRLDHGPAYWDKDRDAPRFYMGGERAACSAPPETVDEWKDHGCLGAWSRSRFVLSVDKHVRRKGRSNRHYERASDHTVDLTHYYERHLDAVTSLGAEMGARGG